MMFFRLVFFSYIFDSVKNIYIIISKICYLLKDIIREMLLKMCVCVKKMVHLTENLIF